MRRLLLLLLVVAGPAGFLWYRAQDAETREVVEIRLLKVMDFLREWERTPIEIVRVLDVVADYVPVSRGVVVDLSAFDEKNEYVFAGLPRARADLRVLRNRAYLVGYDEGRQNPAWVAYRLFKVPDSEAPERPEGFIVDTRTRARVRSESYTGSGYDRGHLAPSFGIGLCYGAEAQAETFLLSNIAPQTPQLNRGLWRELESRTARRLSQRFEEVWVITGPIYAPRPADIAPLSGGVNVPEAFFKIILDETPEGVRALALIVPQEPPAGSGLHDFLVSIDAVEAATRLDFFASLPDDVEAALERVANKRVW